MFTIPPQTPTSAFKLKFNKTQKQLKSIAGVDELLSGMLPLNLGSNIVLLCYYGLLWFM